MSNTFLSLYTTYCIKVQAFYFNTNKKCFKKYERYVYKLRININTINNPSRQDVLLSFNPFCFLRFWGCILSIMSVTWMAEQWITEHPRWFEKACKLYILNEWKPMFKKKKMSPYGERPGKDRDKYVKILYI